MNEKKEDNYRISKHFKVEKGQLTFDAEGQEGGRFHSRVPHVPDLNSGITIGRGYDMKTKKPAKIKKDLLQAMLREADIGEYLKCAGKVGEEAKRHLANNKCLLAEITPKQQKKLFEIAYAECEQDVERICRKPDTVAKYGSVDFGELDIKIKKRSLSI